MKRNWGSGNTIVQKLEHVNLPDNFKLVVHHAEGDDKYRAVLMNDNFETIYKKSGKDILCAICPVLNWLLENYPDIHS